MGIGYKMSQPIKLDLNVVWLVYYLFYIFAFQSSVVFYLKLQLTVTEYRVIWLSEHLLVACAISYLLPLGCLNSYEVEYKMQI